MNRLTESIGPRDHVLGTPAALAVLVEYGDYGCSDCARAHYEIAEVLRRVGNDVRYAYRHFPMTHLHPNALLAAQAAEAAGTEGRFWPMHSMLFANQSSLELADLILDEAEVAVVPGEAFGPSGFVRLSYALGDDQLLEGVQRLQTLFS